MNKEYQIVLQLLKESFYPDNFRESEIEKDCDWSKIYIEMQQQTIEALPYEWLKTHDIDNSSVYSEWYKQCVITKCRWIQVMFGQNELLSLLEKNDIDCVIIKGVAAGMAYPVPMLRTMGDIDFLVSREDYERTATVLEKNGYSIIGEKNKDFHHYEYMKDGIVYELHRRLGIFSESDEELLSLFEEGIKDREIRQIETYKFPVLPKELNGFVLLCHINQHIRNGLGLRHIIDWMMYLEENDGLTHMVPLLKKTRMEKFANTITVLCQRYLGLRIFVTDLSDYPCEELIEYIFSKGNFGKKETEINSLSVAFLDMPNPVQMIQRLTKKGLGKWNFAQKHRILIPFAWIYQVGYIINLLISKRISLRTLKGLIETGSQQRNLILRLGLDVDNTIKYEDY